MRLLDTERLKYVRKTLSKISQREFAGKLGVPLHKIRDIEAGKIKISVELASLIEEKFYFDFKWLLTGKGDPYIKAKDKDEHPAVDKSSSVIDSEHTDVIRHFKDKTRARDANIDLLTLERINQTAFIETCAYIKGITSGVQLVTNKGRPYIGPERRVEDRRQKEDPAGIPKKTDRRNGTDRRVAGTKS